jgi:ATP-dependent RNA helicase DDX51/DBP6
MSAPIYQRWAPPVAAIKKTSAAQPPPARTVPQAAIEEDAVEPSPAKASKKPKKRKRESKIDEEEIEVDSGVTSKKHKAILSKYEKSSKLVEAARASGKLEPDAEPQELPSEVLHGMFWRCIHSYKC